MKTVSLRAKIGVATLNIALLSSTIMTTPGMAQDVLPTGGKVVAGSATISTDRGSMTIDQSTDKLVTNWDSFSIGEGNSVTFNQPTAQSIALNRVIGQDPSRILGRLTANGNIFLLNPNGIVISKDGSVQSGGFVGSTLGMSDKDFLDGKYQLSGSGGAIVNHGDLKGGVVALIAPRIQNAGSITGDAALAAGTDVTLDFDGDGLISVEVSASTLGTLVENSGLIKADGGLAILTAKGANDAMRGVVNNSGTIEAAALQNHNGRILLLGDMKHGEANADGTLSASFVETSAARVNIADDLAVRTSGGTWLIDPNDFTIAASGGNMTGVTLSNNLANGNVTITTASQGTAGGNGDIFVNDGVTWSANRLTLNADRNININTAMNASGTAGLALEFAQTDASGDYYVNAPVNLASTASFSTKKGNDATLNYTIITSLGTASSSNDGTLQGVSGEGTGSWDGSYVLGSNRNYVLGSDINASETSNWNGGLGFTPIGSDYFSGNFDGLGHTIYNLNINRGPIGSMTPGQQDIGLFGQAFGANIRNIRLQGGLVSGGLNVGAIVGLHQGSSIRNSYANTEVRGDESVGGLAGYSFFGSKVANSRSEGSVTGRQYVGGLLGRLFEGSIGAVDNSHASGRVEGASDVGGLIGISRFSDIRNSSASGAVIGTDQIGGLVGQFAHGTISSSFATGNVTSTGRIAGGLVGSNAGIVISSYASGSVSGDNVVGGLVGAHDQLFGGSLTDVYAVGNVRGTNAVGGLVGLSDGPISNAYAAGNVVGITKVGGLVGDYAPTSVNKNLISNSFFDSQATGMADACGSISVGAACNATGLTTAQMKDPANFIAAGWNFNTIWAIDPAINNGYPYLRATVGAPVVTPPPPPPPPPPAPVLAINDFGASFSTTTAPYQPTIALSGSNFDAVTEIRFSYTGPNGQAGTIIWNAANQFGGGRFVVGAGGTSATISPVLVAAGDPLGSYQWTVTFVAGNQAIARDFTVAYTAVVVPPPPPPPPPPPVALTLVGGIGSSYSTPVAPYGPVLNLTGSGFQGVTEIRLTYAGPANQSGTIVLNQDNQFRGRWTNVSNGSATFAPVLLVAGDPPGPYRWTVTFVSGGTPVTRTFVVDYTGAQLQPPVTSGLPQNPSGSLLLGGVDTTPLYVTTAPYLSGSTAVLLAAVTTSDIRPALQSLIRETVSAYGGIEDFDIIADNLVYAELSLAAYQNNADVDGWVNLNNDFQNLTHDEATGFNATVFQNKLTGEIVISFRGSDDKNDWITTNIKLGEAQEPQAWALYRAVVQSVFGTNFSVTLTGHSLGGGLAEVIAASTGAKAVIFDPAPFTSSEVKSAQSAYANITSFRNVDDPLTGLTGSINLSDSITVENSASMSAYSGIASRGFMGYFAYQHSMENLFLAMQDVYIANKTLGDYALKPN